MSTTFPFLPDNFPNPAGTTLLNETGDLAHATQHANMNDAIEAVERMLRNGRYLPGLYYLNTPPPTENDEFDDTGDPLDSPHLNSGANNGLNTTRWSWVNQGGATVSFGKQGWGTISVPLSGSINWRFIKQPKPAGNFTIETRLSLEAPRAQYGSVGLLLRNGGNGQFYSFHLACHVGAELKLANDRWANPNNWAATVMTPVFWYQTHAFMRAIYTSATNTIELWASSDGVGWVRMASFTDAVGITEVGIGVNEENNTGLTKGHFDYFRRWAVPPP